MCLKTLKPLVKTQYTVLPTPQVITSFINELVSLMETNSPIGQDPVFTRADLDVEENGLSDDEDEQLGMPDDMEGAGRSPTRVQYLNRAFSIPGNNSEP